VLLSTADTIYQALNGFGLVAHGDEGGLKFEFHEFYLFSKKGNVCSILPEM
jgi:hypothetical protein